MVRDVTDLDEKETDGATASFGFAEVAADQKAGMVGEVFNSVAGRYDVMNDLMSAGIHRLWKDRYVTGLRPRAGEHFLDLAGGTGDIALRIIQRTQGAARVTLCDINPAMVEAGRDRMLDRGVLDGIDWTIGDAECLPFPDHHFDGATIAFGIRNVTRIDKALAEIRRVLKPGGRFHCLEFTNVDAALKPAYDLYSFQVLPRLGSLIAGDAASYQYLAESIRRFPDSETFADMIEKAGFANVSCERLTGGIAAIHRGWKV